MRRSTFSEDNGEEKAVERTMDDTYIVCSLIYMQGNLWKLNWVVSEYGTETKKE